MWFASFNGRWDLRFSNLVFHASQLLLLKLLANGVFKLPLSLCTFLIGAFEEKPSFSCKVVRSKEIQSCNHPRPLLIGKPLAPGLQGVKLFLSWDIARLRQQFTLAMAFKKSLTPWSPTLMVA